MSKKDTLAKLNEEQEKIAKNEVDQNEEDQEENEVEQQKDSTGVVKEQSSSNAGKPKSLKELLGDSNEGQAKLPSKEAKYKNKQHEGNKGKEGKPKFFNSKKGNQVSTGYNAENEKKKDEFKPQKFTNSKKNVGQKTMEAPKTKGYLDKEVQKDYKEEKEAEAIPKPEFKGRAEGEEKFAELNTGEDLLLKNMNTKEVKIKNEYKNEENDKPEKKKHYKKDYKKKDFGEDKNDEDSDGFEIVGTREQKKKEKNEYNRQNPNYNKRGNYHKRRGGKQDWGRKKENKEEAKEENKEETKEEGKEEDKNEDSKKEEPKEDNKEEETKEEVKEENKKTKKIVKKDKNVVSIKVKTDAKSLKDLLG